MNGETLALDMCELFLQFCGDFWPAAAPCVVGESAPQYEEGGVEMFKLCCGPDMAKQGEKR